MLSTTREPGAGSGLQARQRYEASLRIHQALIERQPANLQYADDVAVSRFKLGLFLWNLQEDGAIQTLYPGWQLAEQLFEIQPTNLRYAQISAAYFSFFLQNADPLGLTAEQRAQLQASLNERAETLNRR